MARFEFDLGSGICLWSDNDAAKEKFGYPINHWELNISENLKRNLDYLIAWFDTSIDWSSPGDTQDFWTKEEIERFHSCAKKGLDLIGQELPNEFSIKSKYGTLDK